MGNSGKVVLFWAMVTALVGQGYGHDEFCYDDDKCGPSAWSGECSDGERQSPIELDYGYKHFLNAEGRDMFESQGYFQPQSFTLRNNGHTVKASLNEKSQNTFMYGSLLGRIYYFSQIHFHWGSGNNNGSEHILSSTGRLSFPLEAHLVHYSSKYNNLSEAVGSHRPDALAVVGIFFELADEDNPALEPIVRKLRNVIHANSAVQGSNLVLSNLLYQSPFNEIEFIQYDGSLTTPGCYEVVLWNVMVPPVPISLKQLNAFRRLQSSSERALVDNFRPVQTKTGRDQRYFRISTAHGQQAPVVSPPVVKEKESLRTLGAGVGLAGQVGDNVSDEKLQIVICLSTFGGIMILLVGCILIALCYFNIRSRRQRYSKCKTNEDTRDI